MQAFLCINKTLKKELLQSNSLFSFIFKNQKAFEGIESLTKENISQQ